MVCRKCVHFLHSLVKAEYACQMAFNTDIHTQFCSATTPIVPSRLLTVCVCVYVSAQFDNPLYYNSCTMKSCCFAGSGDQYVLSGSDDFSLYMWKVPEDPGTAGAARESWGPSLGLGKKVPNPKYLVNLLLLECFSPENIPGLVRLDGLPSPAYGSNYCKY